MVTAAATAADTAVLHFPQEARVWRRCMTMDDSGWVWVGGAAGNVKAVELAILKQPHGGLSKALEARTPRAPRPPPASTAVASSAAAHRPVLGAPCGLLPLLCYHNMETGWLLYKKVPHCTATS